MTTIGYWLPFLHIPYSLWYISAILVFYLIFPLFIHYFNKRPVGTLLLFCFIGFLLTGIYVWYYLFLHPGEKGYLVFFTARIPIFFIGAYVGCLSNRTEISKRIVNFSIVLSALFSCILCVITSYFDYCILRNGALYYLPFIFIVPGLCVLVSRVIERIPKSCNSLLKFIGSLSLELYLVHEYLFANLRLFEVWIGISESWAWVVVFILSFALAYMLSILVKYVLFLFRYK